MDDADNIATFAYPLLDAGNFDAITGVWLHTILVVSRSKSAMFADGRRVEAQRFLLPEAAHNLANPDPGSLTLPLSNFSMSGEVYIAAAPNEHGQASNFYVGTMAMLAVDTGEISAEDAVCYFRGGEAALSNVGTR